MGRHVCCAINCFNSRKKNPYLHFFKCPTDNERLVHWMKVTKDGSKGHHMCEDHFEESCFLVGTNSRRLTLSRIAIPTLITPDAETQVPPEGDGQSSDEAVTESDPVVTRIKRKKDDDRGITRPAAVNTAASGPSTPVAQRSARPARSAGTKEAITIGRSALSTVDVTTLSGATTTPQEACTGKTTLPAETGKRFGRRDSWNSTAAPLSEEADASKKTANNSAIVQAVTPTAASPEKRFTAGKSVPGSSIRKISSLTTVPSKSDLVTTFLESSRSEQRAKGTVTRKPQPMSRPIQLVPTPKILPVFIQKVQPVAKPTPQPAATACSPTAQPVSSPTVQVVSSPMIQLVSSPTVQLVSSPMIQLVSNSTVQLVPNSTVQLVPIQNVQSVSKPTSQPASTACSPTVQRVSRPMIQLVSRPTVQLVSRPMIQLVPRTKTQTVSSPTVQVVSRPKTLPVLIQNVQSVSKPTSQPASAACSPTAQSVSSPTVQLVPRTITQPVSSPKTVPASTACSPTTRPVSSPTVFDNMTGVNVQESNIEKRTNLSREPRSSLVRTKRPIPAVRKREHHRKNIGSLCDFVENYINTIGGNETATAALAAIQRELDRLTWQYTREMEELLHNACLLVKETKCMLDFGKSLRVREAATRKEKEKLEKALYATKHKRWCFFCLKEATFYCCWNTWYCSYSCQGQHWLMHREFCSHKNNVDGSATAITRNCGAPILDGSSSPNPLIGGASILRPISIENLVPPNGSSRTSTSTVVEKVRRKRPLTTAFPSVSHSASSLVFCNSHPIHTSAGSIMVSNVLCQPSSTTATLQERRYFDCSDVRTTLKKRKLLKILPKSTK